jgi:tetratricopeptide (TPR) repeat protein
MLLLTSMFYRLSTLLCLTVAVAVSSAAQSTNVTMQPDLRLFTTMAALNAAGFDVELASSEYHPVRERVRSYAKEVDADLIARLKAFYNLRKGSQTDESQLAKYISLAVNVTDAPAFKPVTREEALPPDARSVIGFLDLMREYYQKARLSQRWVELRPEYEKAIAKVAPAIREAIVRTDAYMRVPLGGTYLRSMAIYFELAAPVNTVNVRSNQDNYFVVIGDSPNPKVDDIRHAYLHFQIDNLVTTNVTRIQNSAQLLNLVRKADGVDPSYTSEFHVMATESFIRAIEVRIDRLPAARAKEAVDGFYRSGLLLTPYFYGALQEYEQGDSGLRETFLTMARNIQLKTEQARFQETFFKIPPPQKTVARAEVPQPPPLPPADPIRDLLKDAEGAFNSGDTAKAEASFARVLSDFDRDNGPALYGLALIASKKGDSDEAQQFFERAIRSDSAEPGMKVWAYIYLARIFDLDCNRDRAVQYYQQALKVGDNTRNAQAIAQQGLQKAFGDECK